MQICLHLGMSLSCKHPFWMEYAWDILLKSFLRQQKIYCPSQFYHLIFSPQIYLYSVSDIIFILSWNTCKVILICPLKLIFAHKIPHKPLICKTPGVLTKLPKILIKKTQNPIFVIRLVLHFPFKWFPHFWRSRSCSSGGSQTAAIGDTEQWSDGCASNRTFQQHNLSGSRDTKLGFQK